MSHRKVSHYSSGSKLLHWLIALIVMFMLSVSFFLQDLPKDYIGTGFMLHKSFGLLVLFLMILRIIWILRSGRPALPESVPIWQQKIARLLHYSLYFFVILMPVCGWILSVSAGRVPTFFGLFPLPLPFIQPNEQTAAFMSQAHTTIAWIIIALIALHIAAAFKHYFINRDGVFQRMMPGN